MSKPLPSILATDLIKIIDEEIAEAQARIDAYDERAAIRAESLDDGKTTTERANDALERPERFKGEHEVAMAWLRSVGANGARFSKNKR